MSLIDGKDRTMQNIAEFRIIGRVGKISEHDKVTKVNVAANYNRQENGEWVTDTHWNEVTLFGKLIERGGKAQKGDLVHITGRVRQNSYDTAEGRRYPVELIADGFRWEERRGGTERVRPVSPGWSQFHEKKKNRTRTE